MKKNLLMLSVCVLICIGLVSPSFADVLLTWQEAPVSENVDLYQVEIDGQIVADLKPNTYGLLDLADGQHTARVRAHNVWGWSEFSAPFVFVKSVPSAPVGTGLIIVEVQ
jgi:hypothetical protein